VLSCVQEAAFRRADPQSKVFYRLCIRLRETEAARAQQKGHKGMLLLLCNYVIESAAKWTTIDDANEEPYSSGQGELYFIANDRFLQMRGSFCFRVFRNEHEDDYGEF
jgi:hypothetical protein